MNRHRAIDVTKDVTVILDTEQKSTYIVLYRLKIVENDVLLCKDMSYKLRLYLTVGVMMGKSASIR